MFEPPQVSTQSLRTMLKLIANDLDVEDIYGQRNPVTVTREIRAKIAELKQQHPSYRYTLFTTHSYTCGCKLVNTYDGTSEEIHGHACPKHGGHN